MKDLGLSYYVFAISACILLCLVTVGAFFGIVVGFIAMLFFESLKMGLFVGVVVDFLTAIVMFFVCTRQT